MNCFVQHTEQQIKMSNAMHETREISRSGAHNNGVVDHRHKIMMDCLHCMSSHRFEFISVGSTNFGHV